MPSRLDAKDDSSSPVEEGVNSSESGARSRPESVASSISSNDRKQCLRYSSEFLFKLQKSRLSKKKPDCTDELKKADIYRSREDTDKAKEKDGSNLVLGLHRASFVGGCAVRSAPESTLEKSLSSPQAAAKPDRRIGSGRLFHNKEQGQRSMESSRDYGYGQQDRRRQFDFRKDDRRVGRDRRGGYHRDEEPEWFTGGPTSQNDTIELGGFEDVARKEEKARKKRAAGGRRSTTPKSSSDDGGDNVEPKEEQGWKSKEKPVAKQEKEKVDLDRDVQDSMQDLKLNTFNIEDLLAAPEPNPFERPNASQGSKFLPLFTSENGARDELPTGREEPVKENGGMNPNREFMGMNLMNPSNQLDALFGSNMAAPDSAQHHHHIQHTSQHQHQQQQQPEQTRNILDLLLAAGNGAQPPPATPHHAKSVQELEADLKQMAPPQHHHHMMQQRHHPHMSILQGGGGGGGGGQPTHMQQQQHGVPILGNGANHINNSPLSLFGLGGHMEPPMAPPPMMMGGYGQHQPPPQHPPNDILKLFQDTSMEQRRPVHGQYSHEKMYKQEYKDVPTQVLLRRERDVVRENGHAGGPRPIVKSNKNQVAIQREMQSHHSGNLSDGNDLLNKLFGKDMNRQPMNGQPMNGHQYGQYNNGHQMPPQGPKMIRGGGAPPLPSHGQYNPPMGGHVPQRGTLDHLMIMGRMYPGPGPTHVPGVPRPLTGSHMMRSGMGSPMNSMSAQQGERADNNVLAKWFGDLSGTQHSAVPPVPMGNVLRVEELERQHAAALNAKPQAVHN